MSDRMRIRRHIGAKVSNLSPTPARNLLQTRGFGNGMQARSPELPATNLLQKRTVSPPTQKPPQPQETPDLQTQLKRAEQFGYNAANIPLFAPGAMPSASIQATLMIGEPGDSYEQEADRVATQVVNQKLMVQRQSDGDVMQLQTKLVQPLNINHSLLQRQITTTKEGYTITVENGLKFLSGFDSAREKLLLKHFLHILEREHTQYHDLKNLKWDLRTKVDQALQEYSPEMLNFLTEFSDNIDAHQLIYNHSSKLKTSKSATTIKFIFLKNIAPDQIPSFITFANALPADFNIKKFLLSKHIYDLTRIVNLDINSVIALVQECEADKVKTAFLYDLAKRLPKILLTPQITTILAAANIHKDHLNIIQSLTDEPKLTFFTANHSSIPQGFDLADFDILYQLNLFPICQSIEVSNKIELVKFCSKNDVRKFHLISLCKFGQKVPSLPTLTFLGDLTSSQNEEIVVHIIRLIEDDSVDNKYLSSIKPLLQDKEFYEYTDKKVTEELDKEKTNLGVTLAEEEKQTKFDKLKDVNNRQKNKVPPGDLATLYRGGTVDIKKTREAYQKLIKNQEVTQEYQQVEQDIKDKKALGETKIDDKKPSEMQKYSQYIEGVESQTQDRAIITYAINLVKILNLDFKPANILVKYAIKNFNLTNTITQWAIEQKKYKDLDKLCTDVFALGINSLPMIILLMDEFKTANDNLSTNSTIHQYIVGKAQAATDVNVFREEMKWYVLWFIDNKQTDINIDNILTTFTDLRERKDLTKSLTNSNLRNQLVTYKTTKQPNLFAKIRQICMNQYSTLDDLDRFFDCLENNYQTDFENLCDLYISKKGLHVVQSVFDAHHANFDANHHNNAPIGFISWLVANAANVKSSDYFLGHENAYHEYLCSNNAATLVNNTNVQLTTQRPTTTSGTNNDILQVFDVQITLHNGNVINSEVHNHVNLITKRQTSLHVKNNGEKGRELSLTSNLSTLCRQATLADTGNINTRFPAPDGYKLS